MAISFTGLHILAEGIEEQGWFIGGDFTFDDEDDYEEFKTGIESAFELLRGYSVPTVLTHAEYTEMNDLLASAQTVLIE